MLEIGATDHEKEDSLEWTECLLSKVWVMVYLYFLGKKSFFMEHCSRYSVFDEVSTFALWPRAFKEVR